MEATMPEHDETADRLRREFLRQAPEFELATSLPGKVSGLVRRRRRLRVIAAVAATAAVIAAVAVPLSALRSTPLGHAVTPATTPTSEAPTTPTTAAGSPLSCNTLDLSTTPAGTRFTTSTSLGQVTATLDATTGAAPSGEGLSEPVLTVTIAGMRFTATVSPPEQTGGDVIPPAVILSSLAPLPADAAPTPQSSNSDGLCLVHFRAESLPTLLIGLSTGYAHCCTVIRAIGLSSTGLSPAVDENTMNAPASLSPTGGDAVIVTADNAFAYQFTSFAFSGLPVRMLQFSQGKFVDVTRAHLDLVATDASRWWSAFTANPDNGLGLLAAWVADECVVGHGTSAWATVGQLETEGKLVGPTGGNTDTNGAAYVSSLKGFLAQHGYCPS
jgi:hypothetical protein